MVNLHWHEFRNNFVSLALIYRVSVYEYHSHECGRCLRNLIKFINPTKMKLSDAITLIVRATTAVKQI